MGYNFKEHHGILICPPDWRLLLWKYRVSTFSSINAGGHRGSLACRGFIDIIQNMLPLKTWIQRFQVPIPNPTERPASTAIPSYLGILYLLGNFWSYTPVSAEITPFMAHFFAVCILTLFNPTSRSVYS